MQKILIVLLLLGLGYTSYEAFGLYNQQKHQTALKEDLAEIHKINYGLFNIQLWKETAFDLFQGKIKDFKLNPRVYNDVDVQLRAFLLKFYRDYFESGRLIDEYFKAEARKGKEPNKFLKKMIEDNMGSILESINLKARIPSISAELIEELKKSEPVLTGYLKDELKTLLYESNPEVYNDPRVAIYQKYETEDIASCTEKINAQISANESPIQRKLRLIYGLLIGVIIIASLLFKKIGTNGLVIIFTVASLIMLGLGVTLPMIDIDARLNDFRMAVLGNEIAFDEQYLYFQSKSILDVTRTLIRGGGIDLKIVGFLILMFSVIFPFFKLILSTGYLYIDKIRNSKLAKNIIFYLGKWSMADVFVVAMFMAYIGFYGLVTSQLGEIGRNQTGFAVETLNYSKLSPGALFFTSYCVLSIITSIVINKTQKS